jgi:PAS domain S-box-containing protein
MTRDDFLAGGGEMGFRMRALDWSDTPLGAGSQWPQSLRTAVSILINSKYPMFLAWGEQLTFLYNDGYGPILGAKHPQALGRPFARIWAEIWSDISPLVSRALSGEPTWSEDLPLFMSRHGYLEEVYFTFSYSPIRDESGGVGGMFCACTETTAQVLQRRRLRTLTELGATAAVERKTVAEIEELCLRAIAANREDCPFALIYRYEEDGARLVGRTGLAEDSSLAPPTVVGNTIWPLAIVRDGNAQLVSGWSGESKAPQSPWGDAIAAAQVLPISRREQSGANAAIVLGVNPRREFDEAYKVFFQRVASAITTAIASARAFEMERERADTLAALDRAKTAFFSNVSHEFRTPLTLLLGPLEDTLQRMRDAPAAERAELETAHRNALRLLRLVNTLLDFSRVEAARIQASYEPVDLCALTADLASNFRTACDKAGLDLVIDCAAGLTGVYVDPDMWEKIVLNLLSNAFKYTLEGSIRVQLRHADDGAAAELIVADTGVGIPESDLPRVFERFHRVQEQKGRTQEGTGIGLALVQELVKQHSGSISVESTVGQGSAFHVRIPFGVEHLPRDRIAPPRNLVYTASRATAFIEEALRWLPSDDSQRFVRPSLGTQTLRTTAVEFPQPKPRVLIADDSADMRHYIERLMRWRYEVEVVADGAAALESIRSNKPDILITDVMMPQLDGIELVNAVRKDPELSALPIIMLSARAGEEVCARGRSGVADDYLVKPFSARELVSRADNLVRLARARAETLHALQASEQRFREMADNSPVIIWITDVNGEVTFLNRTWVEFTGLPRENACGSSWLNLVHPDDRERIRDEFLAIHERRAQQRLEYRVRRADGEYRWMIDTASPYVDTSGEFHGYIGSVIDFTERKHEEQSLQQAKARLEREVEERTAERDRLWLVSSELMAVANRNGRLRAVNPAWTTTLGFESDALLRMYYMELVHPEDVIASIAWIDRALRGEPFGYFENRIRHVDGSYRWISWTGTPGEGLLYCVGRDITGIKESTHALREAEERLRQSQKMEAIGHLTGGVAHDFNNLLTVVIGNLDSLQRHLHGNGSERLRRSADHAMQGARRAASLTQRLLAFARRQPLDPKPIDPNKLVSAMSDLLARTLGERIEVQTVLAAGLWRVEVDPNQLESALLNLAVNARDAMTEGGKLTIETANTYLDERYAQKHADVASGQYVVLSVSDSGIGMSAEVVTHVFEPFFTTKPTGHGTGLGLSQVYGFVKQSGGHVKLYSEPNEGTTVKLYLPRLVGQAGEETTDVLISAPAGDFSETVLVVEDEDGVRDYACDILSELGYRVLQANDGPAALRMLERESVDLLFTDVGLPSMNGRELATEALQRRPHLKVLFTTGYARNAVVHHGRLDPGIQMIGKPFTYSDLAAKIRYVLDRP